MHCVPINNNHKSRDFLNNVAPPNDFASSILNIESLLENIKSFLDKEEVSILKNNINIDKDFIISNYLHLIQNLNDLVNHISKFLENISKDQFLIYQKLTQEKIGRFFMSSPFPNRAFNKPLGFVGDYKMMYMIQELEDEGGSLFSQFINVYYTNIPISNSVKNRTDILAKSLQNIVNDAKNNGLSEVQILSIGCGPALEVKKYLKQNNSNIKTIFNLLDFNRETLEFAQDQSLILTKDTNSKINLIEESVYNLMHHKSFEEILGKKCDFIYCSGLFDYLSNKLCKKLVDIFYNSLNKGGKLLITNMHLDNNDRHLMELLLDWHLIYRKESDVVNFVNNLWQYNVFTDSTGVNLCLEIQKK
ncbi:hypothetical protein N9X24_01980 [Rickettsiales bacterium]|nr:hypothetical protein [Rickettsiales bacterium]